MRARACGAASGCAAHLRASVPSELAEAAPPPPAQPCGCRSPPASPGRRGAAAAALWAPPPPAGPAAHAPVSAHAGACLPGAAAVLAAPAEAGGARAPRLGGAAPGGAGGGEPDLSAVAAELRTVLSQFPAVRHAFAYGSGVFEQPGLYAAAGGAGAGAGARPMLDFIFAAYAQRRPLTSGAAAAQNIQRNRAHYSSLASLGASAVRASRGRRARLWRCACGST